MSRSTLSQVLAAFQDNRGPLTMSQIARDLDVSPARLEGMLQYWVRKGKLRETVNDNECGACGSGDESCPYTVDLPRGYELVTEDSITIPLTISGASCSHKRQ